LRRLVKIRESRPAESGVQAGFAFRIIERGALKSPLSNRPYGFPRSERVLLSDVPEPQHLTVSDNARIRGFETGDDFEKRRLPRSVRSDQTDALTFGNGYGYVFEE
jgi:hypothetical protein